MMKNKNKIIIIGIVMLLITLFCIFLFINKKIIITFDTNGGNKINNITIKKNGTINLPKPYKEHYLFNGWYTYNKKINNKYKFRKDSKLVAKWTKEKYVVTFCIEDDKNCTEKITVNYQDKVKEPASPNKDGYQFLGWYLNDTKYNFDSSVEKDILLIAKLEKIVEKEVNNDEHGYYCPSGYSLNENKCTKTYSIKATIQYVCPEGSEYWGKTSCFDTSGRVSADEMICPEGTIMHNTGTRIKCYYNKQELNETECNQKSWNFYNGICYADYCSPNCKNGKPYTISYLDGKEVYYCGGEYSTATPTYTCPTGYNLSKNMCYKTETINANYK